MLTCPTCGRPSTPDASFCAGCGSPLGATATAHEVRKTVTALFCDLVGSTALGEAYDPEVLRGALEAYFDLARASVERHGGRVEKFVGDAVNAVFGLPVAHEDDALRAVRAGMEIQAGLADLATTSAVPLAARVGITTGEVLAPGTGRPLIGDAMNTASRLQSGAGPGSVVIGEPTWRLVRDAVVAEPLPPLEARGKAEPVAAHRVLAVASGSPMRARRMDAPMVGRTREATALRNAFERAVSDRTCELFTVLGVAGAGKSRLVEEFLATLSPEAEVLRGRCLSYGEGITWLPVTDALREAFGLPEFAETDAIRSAIAAAVAGEEHAAALEANLAGLFAAGSGGTAEETRWAVRRLLESRGREHPLVLVLDDIHWGEEAFLDLVEHLADWSRDASILVLCMARPDLLDVRPAWGGGKTNATTISLAPLTVAETDALVDGLLGSTALPPEVHERVRAVAGGNPLFTEELLRMLVDEGRLVRDDGRWVAAGDLAQVPVPPTVSALLSARIDRLSDAERVVLEAAAIEGQSFHAGAVVALVPEADRAGIATHLRSLVRKELVVPERSAIPGQDAYHFRHLLIRDAAYDAIPKRARAELHRAFADWLEGVAGERIAEQLDVLGFHLHAAHRYREELGLPEDRDLRVRAGRALSEAGELAFARADVRASAALLRAASTFLRGDREEMEVLGSLSLSLWSVGDAEASTRALQQLSEAAERHADPVSAMRARFLLRTGEVLAGLEPWDLDETSRLCDEASAVYRRHGATRHLPDVVLWQSIVAWECGDSVTLIARAREAVELSARLGGGALASSLNSLCAGLAGGPMPLSAVLAEIDAMLAAFPDNPWIETTIRDNRAGVLAELGLVGEAKAQWAAVQETATDLGLWQVVEGRALLDGVIARVEGDLDIAEERLRAAIDFMEAHGLGFNTVFAGDPLARILLERGREADAVAVVRQLQDRFGPPYRLSAVPGLSIAGVLAARRGDIDEALRFSDSAVAMVSAMDFVVFQGDVAIDRAEVLLLAGRSDEARASATAALERYERKEYAIGIRRARAFLERLDARDAGAPIPGPPRT